MLTVASAGYVTAGNVSRFEYQFAPAAPDTLPTLTLSHDAAEVGSASCDGGSARIDADFGDLALTTEPTGGSRPCMLTLPAQPANVGEVVSGEFSATLDERPGSGEHGASATWVDVSVQ